MKRVLTIVLPVTLAALVAGVVAFEGACNNVGTCPTDPITPGAGCTGDNLQCPYTLQSPDPACDGTNVDGGVATSCVCTDGLWVCPDPTSCPDAGAPTDDGGGDAEDTDGETDDGGADGDVDDGGTDGGADAPADSNPIDAADANSADAADGSSDAAEGG